MSWGGEERVGIGGRVGWLDHQPLISIFCRLKSCIPIIEWNTFFPIIVIPLMMNIIPCLSISIIPLIISPWYYLPSIIVIILDMLLQIIIIIWSFFTIWTLLPHIFNMVFIDVLRQIVIRFKVQMTFDTQPLLFSPVNTFWVFWFVLTYVWQLNVPF